MFVTGPECFLVLAQLDTKGNISSKFKKNPTNGLVGDAITRNVYRRTPESSQTIRKARPEELIISKRALKFR